MQAYVGYNLDSYVIPAWCHKCHTRTTVNAFNVTETRMYEYTVRIFLQRTLENFLHSCPQRIILALDKSQTIFFFAEISRMSA